MISIKELRPGECPDYLQLLSELDHDRTLPLEEAERMFQKIRSYPYYKIFCAFTGDQMVGTFSLIICDNFGHGGLRFAIIENVVVRPGVQRAGIGRKMMETAMQLASDNHCYKVMLSSNKKREAAHAFYDSLGFERHGVSFMTELMSDD